VTIILLTEVLSDTVKNIHFMTCTGGPQKFACVGCNTKKRLVSSENNSVHCGFVLRTGKFIILLLNVLVYKHIVFPNKTTHYKQKIESTSYFYLIY